MALTKVEQIVITDWVQVLQGGVSAFNIDVSTYNKVSICLQGFIDTTDTTAHAGTEFLIGMSTKPTPASADDEDWHDAVPSFVRLIGTMNPEPQLHLTDPAPTTTTVFPVTSTTGYVVADVTLPWAVLHDPTPTNSELVRLNAISANTSITILNGSMLAHAKTTTLFGNIAFSEVLEKEVVDWKRMRVIVNNNFDSNGAKIYVRITIVANSKLS
jgi:hypothetical protein